MIALDDLRSSNDHTIALITERICSELIIIHSITIPLHAIYIRNTTNPIWTKRERKHDMANLDGSHLSTVYKLRLMGEQPRLINPFYVTGENDQ